MYLEGVVNLGLIFLVGGKQLLHIGVQFFYQGAHNAWLIIFYDVSSCCYLIDI